VRANRKVGEGGLLVRRLLDGRGKNCKTLEKIMVAGRP
jgi:hypothetical protein